MLIADCCLLFVVCCVLFAVCGRVLLVGVCCRLLSGVAVFAS